MQLFEVGGCIRDEILGLDSKDIDFTVVLTDEEAAQGDPYYTMNDQLRDWDFRIFLETPEFFTTRARFPTRENNVRYQGLTGDFVLARKESEYTDGRRPDVVEAGTLEDDLARRDFTMNAIAKSPAGFIDPFNGIADIEAKVIRAVGDPLDRLREDALRAVRALRFSVTKNFTIDPTLAFAMNSVAVLDSIRNKISDERIQQELSKMFRFDTVTSITRLNEFPQLTAAMFNGSVSLDATLKLRGRG